MLRAIDKLKVLGGGFNVFKVGSQTLVRSVPGELNRDKNQALKLAQGRGYISNKRLSEVSHRTITFLALLTLCTSACLNEKLLISRYLPLMICNFRC